MENNLKLYFAKKCCKTMNKDIHLLQSVPKKKDNNLLKMDILIRTIKGTVMQII